MPNWDKLEADSDTHEVHVNGMATTSIEILVMEDSVDLKAKNGIVVKSAESCHNVEAPFSTPLPMEQQTLVMDSQR